MPLNLLVSGRRCVVVGAGRVAARKIEALLDAGADVHVVAPVIGQEVSGWRDEGAVQVAERAFVPSDLDDAWLAVAATGDTTVNRSVRDAGDERRVWVNAVDDPEHCSATMMSTVRRGDLVITVGTGGRSPALAKWLKDRLMAELGPEYETLLEILAEARDEVHAGGRSSEDADWRRALDSGMLDLLRSGRVAEAKELPAHVSLVVVGLNHRTVPVEFLERMTVPAAELPKALAGLTCREHLAEVVLLSTCNRTEVYARTTLFHPGIDDMRHYLAEQAGTDPDDLADCLYTYHDDAAVAHLFAVAAGLDSMIVGEAEILGQVREAAKVATKEQAAGPLLTRTFRHAVEVGRRARAETGIGRHAASVASAAVSVAADRLGSFAGRRVLLLGAGGVGADMAMALSGSGVAEIVVVNRTAARAKSLAERVGGRAVSFDRLLDALVDVDVLLSSTGAPGVLVERSDVEAVMERRDGRALLVVDVAVPRDVDPGVGEVFGVTLLDIDALRDVGERALAQHGSDVARVREIVTEELDRFRLDRSAREVAPLVSALRARAEAARCAELARQERRLATLPPEAREAVDAVTKGLVNKLLHDPTVQLKDAAGTARGELLADALASLFALDESRPDS